MFTNYRRCTKNTLFNRVLLFIACIVTPLAVGGLSSFLTKDMMFHFGNIKKPPLAPPGFLFPIVWTILYILMGIAFYLILTHDTTGNNSLAVTKNVCIVLFIVQLVFNFFWSIIFFRFKMYFPAFFWLLALLAMVIVLSVMSFKINRFASLSFIPYILWMTFASYLNIGIAFLN